jgi:hypothetical protein
MEQKVIIAEFGSWHDECLYSICLLLKRQGYHVTLAANERLRKRVDDTLALVTDERRYYAFGNGCKGMAAVWQFYRFVLHSGICRLHLNTAQGSIVWKFFLLPLPRRITVTGTLHNVKKLQGSLGQRFITRRVDHYILLSDLLLPTYRAVTHKPALVLYPIFYPEYRSLPVSKPPHEVWITIPGAASLARRDYSILPPPAGQHYVPHIKFIILGNIQKEDGASIRQELMVHGMEANVIFFEEFIPNELFYSYIALSDYILPLVHPHNPHYRKYITDKISGSYSLAMAYRKPMLCPVDMHPLEDFVDTAFFYPIDGFSEFINALPASPDISQLYRLSKWSIEAQQERIASIYPVVPGK